MRQRPDQSDWARAGKGRNRLMKVNTKREENNFMVYYNPALGLL